MATDVVDFFDVERRPILNQFLLGDGVCAFVGGESSEGDRQHEADELHEQCGFSSDVSLVGSDVVHCGDLHGSRSIHRSQAWFRSGDPARSKVGASDVDHRDTGIDRTVDLDERDGIAMNEETTPGRLLEISTHPGKPPHRRQGVAGGTMLGTVKLDAAPESLVHFHSKARWNPAPPGRLLVASAQSSPMG